MSKLLNNIDINSLATCSALVISVASPAITTILTNRHQRKMRELDIKLNADATRRATLEAFVGNIGKCVVNANLDNQSDFGFSYFAAYQYIPCRYWNQLDALYDDIRSANYDSAVERYRCIIRVVAGLLNE